MRGSESVGRLAETPLTSLFSTQSSTAELSAPGGSGFTPSLGRQT